MTKYLSPEQVCELLPGITTSQLGQWRYRGIGPRYRKLGKKVVYAESEVVDFVESTSRQGTALEAV